MKHRIFWGLLVSILFFIATMACNFSNEGDRTAWVTINFTLDNPPYNPSITPLATSTLTSLVLAVPSTTTSIAADNYLFTNYDLQLQNLTSNTVALTVPFDVSMRLIKVNFDEVLTLQQITSSSPEALQFGLSEPFTISRTETIKTVSITMETNTPTVSLSSLYTNGSGWNDYVKNDGADIYAAGDVVCDGTETEEDACIHGGELRTFTITGIDSCSGLTTSDSLGVFEWQCMPSSSVQFVSAGFNNDKGLSDLIDFTAATPAWRSMTVTVLEAGNAVAYATTTAWADNTITVDNNGGSLTGGGGIYAVTSNPGASYSIESDNIALVVAPGVTLTGSSGSSSTVSADARRFIWFEGNVDASNTNSGISWSDVRFSRIRNTGISNAAGSDTYDAGIAFSSCRYNLVDDTVIIHGQANGVYASASSYNRWERITVANNKTRGLWLSTSSYNKGSDIKALYNSSIGIYISSGYYSRMNRLLLVGNNDGLYVLYGWDHSFTGILAANNSGDGLVVFASSNNHFNNATATNNGDRGFYATPGASPPLEYTSFINMVAANNYYAGLDLDRSNYAHVHNYVGVSNDFGVYSHDVTDDTYTGLLKVGGNSLDCSVPSGTNPGIDGSCASSATLTTSVTVAGSFIGKVTSDDTTNQSDSSGTATFPTNLTTFDWGNFDNDFRGWGVESTDNFPSGNHQGRFGCSDTSGAETDAACSATWNGSGRIWDWSVASADTVLLDVLPLPTGSDYLTHTWNDSSTTNYLKNSAEIMLDGIGNDNLLCESNETCLYTPNMGTYQGHGELISAGAFTNGTLTGIALVKYEDNGR
jgi:copper-binding protein NosD